MSDCAHPASALFVDRTRGVTVCTLCGDVVNDQQFELDPVFERGAAGGAGAGAARAGGALGRGAPANSLRNLGGSLRPTRSTGGSNFMAHNPRPSLDAARREMVNIARSLEISDDIVEIALGIYTTALQNHAVSGTRSVVLCACLYAACRRERTTHIIYDFSTYNRDSPHAILSHMKHICEATHTDVPTVDPSALIQRLAEHMALGDHVVDVVVCALKVLRAMRDDWIACGRRPMGVCAAALLVACSVFNVPRSAEEVCGMARLTSSTIARRLSEFSATPAALLENIDDYQKSESTLPPAFGQSSLKSTEEDMGADMRELSSLYYELVAEAKTSAPVTEERRQRWRRFIVKHCELENQSPKQESLELQLLTPEDQLRILGLPHTKPISQVKMEESLKREEVKLTMKQEGDSQRDLGSLPPTQTFNPRDVNGARAPIDYNDPAQMGKLTTQFHALLSENPEVRGLHEDFDFSDGDDELFPSSKRNGTAVKRDPGLCAPYGELSFPDAESQLSFSPSAATPGDGSRAFYAESERRAALDQDQMKAVLEEILRDKDRRHALPWEILVLQETELEDSSDILQYLVLDNEERLRRQKVGLSLYKEDWQRGRPRTEEEIQQLEENRLIKKRRRHVITAPAPVHSALERALRGRGTATVNTENLPDIFPGLLEEDDTAQEEWEY